MSSTLEEKAKLRKTKRLLRFVVLDSEWPWLDELGRDKTAVCTTRDEVIKALDRIDANSLWISRHSERTEELVETLVELMSKTRKHWVTFGNLLTLEAVTTRVRPSLDGLFGQVVGVSREFKKLPVEQLASVLGSDPELRRDVFIGGTVDLRFGTLVLVRGNLERVVVPLSMFRPSGRAKPDFKKFEFDDYGQTLRFGDYEATADVVLWEVDPDYRKRAKA